MLCWIPNQRVTLAQLWVMRELPPCCCCPTLLYSSCLCPSINPCSPSYKYTPALTEENPCALTYLTRTHTHTNTHWSVVYWLSSVETIPLTTWSTLSWVSVGWRRRNSESDFSYIPNLKNAISRHSVLSACWRWDYERLIKLNVR